jgi:hypothetical protein
MASQPIFPRVPVTVLEVVVHLRFGLPVRDLLEPRGGRVAVGRDLAREEDLAAVGRPNGPRGAPLHRGQRPRLAAVHRNDPDLRAVAPPRRHERDAPPVGRPRRGAVGATLGRDERTGLTPVYRHAPDLRARPELGQVIGGHRVEHGPAVGAERRAPDPGQGPKVLRRDRALRREREGNEEREEGGKNRETRAGAHGGAPDGRRGDLAEGRLNLPRLEG